MTKHVIPLDRQGLAKARHWLSKVPDDGSWKVTFEENKPTRSLAQNALMWQWNRMIADYATENTDETYSNLEMHYLLKDMFLPKKVVTGFDGQPRVMVGDTHDLSVAEFSEYLLKIEHYCAERQIPLEKGEYYDNAMAA